MTHLGSLLQPVTGLAHAAVENQLLHADLPHGVVELLVSLRASKQCAFQTLCLQPSTASAACIVSWQSICRSLAAEQGRLAGNLLLSKCTANTGTQ